MRVLDQRYKASEAQLRALRGLEKLPAALKDVHALATWIAEESGTVSDEVQKICPEVFDILLVHALKLQQLHARLYDKWEDERAAIDEEMERE